VIPTLLWLTFTPLAADPTSDPVALVKQLGSADFAEREAAQKELRELGTKAELALKVGLKSEDPEVRGRAAQLLVTIRNDALNRLVKTFDPAGTAEPDHPIWKRYKAIAGNDEPARRLFAEIIRDPCRLRLLDIAETNPDKVGALYEQHVKQIGANIQKGLEYQQQRFGRGNARGARFAPDVFGGDDPTPTPADVAVAYHLGTFPITAKAFPDPQWEQWAVSCGGEEGMAVFGNAFQQGLDFPYRRTPTAPAFARLFAGWPAVRRNPGSIAYGLAFARIGEVAEALPTARTIAADGKEPVRVRVETIPILGVFGEAKDESLVATLLDDKTVIGQCKYGPAQKEAQVQARDIALATLLVMRGKDPGDFGFPGLEFHRAGPLKTILRGPHYLGFYDDASRAAAHEKAKEWLDKPKK
jgi:hypothetical protein